MLKPIYLVTDTGKSSNLGTNWGITSYGSGESWEGLAVVGFGTGWPKHKPTPTYTCFVPFLTHEGCTICYTK